MPSPGDASVLVQQHEANINNQLKNQQANIHRLNKDNAWSYTLVDHLDKVAVISLEAQDRANQFKKASVTIDNSTKIYSNRVDSVYSTATRTAELISQSSLQTTKTKKGKKSKSKTSHCAKREVITHSAPEDLVVPLSFIAKSHHSGIFSDIPSRLGYPLLNDRMAENVYPLNMKIFHQECLNFGFDSREVLDVELMKQLPPLFDGSVNLEFNPEKTSKLHGYIIKKTINQVDDEQHDQMTDDLIDQPHVDIPVDVPMDGEEVESVEDALSKLSLFGDDNDPEPFNPSTLDDVFVVDAESARNLQAAEKGQCLNGVDFEKVVKSFKKFKHDAKSVSKPKRRRAVVEFKPNLEITTEELFGIKKKRKSRKRKVVLPNIRKINTSKTLNDFSSEANNLCSKCQWMEVNINHEDDCFELDDVEIDHEAQWNTVASPTNDTMKGTGNVVGLSSKTVKISQLKEQLDVELNREEENEIEFSTVSSRITHLAPSATVQLNFICLLHLCNEKGIRLSSTSDFKDLTIRK
ncbi:hypothetical protein P9112_008014 [Eukaryota sp. TZLM1-RC]